MKRGWQVVIVLATGGLGVFLGWLLFARGAHSRAHAPVPEADYVPPKTADPALAPLVNRTLKINERIPPDITSRIPTVARPEDIPVLVATLGDTREDDTVRNEVANLLERSNYPRLADELLKVLDSQGEGPRFRAFAAQHLAMMMARKDDQQGKIRQRLRSALDDRDVEVRREALLALARQKDPEAVGTVVRLLTSTDKDAESMRDLAIHCAGSLNLREQVAAIRTYLRDSNEVIRIAAIVVLSQWGDEASRPAFEEAAKSGTARLQRAGKAALDRLAKATASRKESVTQPSPTQEKTPHAP